MRPGTMLERVSLVVVALVLAGCVENTAPGNDRAAELEPPAPAAEVASAASAVGNLSTHLLVLETMTEADVGNAPAVGGESCRFLYTRVGYPVVLYGSTAAVVKVNGKLAPLDRVGEGRYEAGGVRVTVEPLEEGADGEMFPSEMVVWFPHAENELGFHGFSECGTASP